MNKINSKRKSKTTRYPVRLEKLRRSIPIVSVIDVRSKEYLEWAFADLKWRESQPGYVQKAGDIYLKLKQDENLFRDEVVCLS